MIKLIATASDIARSINRDLDNRPNFTMTRSQLRARFESYCDDPATTDADIDAAFALLASDPIIDRLFRD